MQCEFPKTQCLLILWLFNWFMHGCHACLRHPYILYNIQEVSWYVWFKEVLDHYVIGEDQQQCKPLTSTLSLTDSHELWYYWLKWKSVGWNASRRLFNSKRIVGISCVFYSKINFCKLYKQVETQTTNQRRCNHGLWPEANVRQQYRKWPDRLVHQM